MDNNKCYLCEKLCYCDSQPYDKCEYRKKKSFGSLENRAYEEACTRLAVKFGQKHGWRFEGWVGYFSPEKHNWYEGAGGWAQFSSEDVVAMDDLRADLMMDAHPDAYLQYMDASVEEGFRAEREGRQPRYVNFRNWLLGARHNVEDSSEEWKERQRLEAEEAKQRADEAKRQLEEEIQRYADELQAGSDGCW